MPLRKPVPTLLSLSVQSQVRYVISISEEFIRNAITYDSFTQKIITLQLHLRYQLYYGDPQIATFWLEAADDLARRHNFEDDDFPNSLMPKMPFIIDTLVEIATNFSVEGLVIHPWTERVQASLMKNLYRMQKLTSLSEINVASPSGWKIVHSLPYLTNLTSISHGVSFTDHLISLLCKYCRRMKTIALNFSGITDNSIKYFARFKELQCLDLVGTNVTSKGLVKFLLTSQSEDFAEINVFKTDQFISHLVSDVVPFRTFNIRILTCSLKSTQLPLIPRYFPSLTQIKLFRFLSIDWSSLLFLDSLEHLEEAAVRVHNYDQHLGLSPPRGSVLTKLELLDVVEIDFLELALRLPNLQFICLRNCLFSNVDLRHHGLVNAFRELRSFKFVYRKNVSENLFLSLNGVNKIFSRAVHLVEFKFRANVVLPDNFITSAISINPLNELEKLQLLTHDISLPILKDLINHCPMLFTVRLSDTFPQNKLRNLRRFVIRNNYDIYLTPI